MHHIFIEENVIENKTIILSKENDCDTFNHLVKSLRVNVDEMVLCSVPSFEFSFDYLCKVVNVTSDSVTLAIIDETKEKELPVEINLYQGISKSDKLEFIIEKAVELGVRSITPISTEYCVAKIDDKKSDRKIDRFRKIAKSAAEQSKRHIIPKVCEPVEYSDLINKMAKDNSAGNITSKWNILFYENAKGISRTREIIKEIKEKAQSGNDICVNLIIGPEGGFSAREIDMAKDKGIIILSLGERILRTETAAVAALSIFMYELS